MVHIFSVHQQIPDLGQVIPDGGEGVSKIPSWTTAARLARAFEHLTPLHQAQVSTDLLIELLRDTLRLRKSRGTQRTWKSCLRLLTALENRGMDIQPDLLRDIVGAGLEYFKKRLKTRGLHHDGSLPAQFQRLLKLADKHFKRQPRIRPGAASLGPSVSLDHNLRRDLLWCLLADHASSVHTSPLVFFNHLRLLLLGQTSDEAIPRFVQPILTKLSIHRSRRNNLRIWQILYHLRHSSHSIILDPQTLEHISKILSKRASEAQDTPTSSITYDNDALSRRYWTLPPWDVLLEELVAPPDAGPASSAQPGQQLAFRLSFALALLNQGTRSSLVYRSLLSLLSEPWHNLDHPQHLFRLLRALSILPSGRFRSMTPQRKLGLAALLTAAVRIDHYSLAKQIYLIFRNRIAKTDSHWKTYLSLFSLSNPSGTPPTTVWLLRRSVKPQSLRQDPTFPIALWSDAMSDASQQHALTLSPELSDTFWRHVGTHAPLSTITQLLSLCQAPLSSREATSLLQANMQRGQTLVTVRVLRLVLRHLRPDALAVEQVWNPLLFSIAELHTRRERLFAFVLRLMGELINETSILALLRLYSRRWDLTASDLDKVQAIRRDMVSRFAVRPDDRHQAEVIYASLRRGRLAEAMLLFMDCEHPCLVGSKIVGMLIIRLADANMYEEAQRVVNKYSGERPLAPALAKAQRVVRDESAVTVASFYVAACKSGAAELDAAALQQMGVQRVDSKAVKRLNKRLAQRQHRQNEADSQP